MNIQLFRKYYKGIRLHEIAVCLKNGNDLYYHPPEYVTPKQFIEAYKKQLDNINQFIKDERN